MRIRTALPHLYGSVTRLLGVALLAVLAVVLTGAPVRSEQPTTAPAARVVQPVQVTVVDHTHGQWVGLQAAVAGWNASPYVHLTVRAACAPSTPCAVLEVGLWGPTTWVAQTNPATAYGPAVIELNLTHRAQPGTTDLWPTAVLCHELGHALGVDHPHGVNGAHGCIAASDPRNLTPVASADDLLALAIARNGGPGLGWGAVYSAQPQE